MFRIGSMLYESFYIHRCVNKLILGPFFVLSSMTCFSSCPWESQMQIWKSVYEESREMAKIGSVNLNEFVDLYWEEIFCSFFAANYFYSIATLHQKGNFKIDKKINLQKTTCLYESFFWQNLKSFKSSKEAFSSKSFHRIFKRL